MNLFMFIQGQRGLPGPGGPQGEKGAAGDKGDRVHFVVLCTSDAPRVKSCSLTLILLLILILFSKGLPGIGTAGQPGLKGEPGDRVCIPIDRPIFGTISVVGID